MQQVTTCSETVIGECLQVGWCARQSSLSVDRCAGGIAVTCRQLVRWVAFDLAVEEFNVLSQLAVQLLHGRCRTYNQHSPRSERYATGHIDSVDIYHQSHGQGLDLRGPGVGPRSRPIKAIKHTASAEIKICSKVLGTCYSATYSSALQSRKWQLFGMSQWCRSALCGHPLPALTDNWTHDAASRQAIAPISHTRPSPRSRSYCSFPVPLRVGGWVGVCTVG